MKVKPLMTVCMSCKCVISLSLNISGFEVMNPSKEILLKYNIEKMKKRLDRRRLLSHGLCKQCYINRDTPKQIGW